MFTKSKYVVGEISNKYGQEICAIVFSELVTHSDVARMFVPGTITGAGFWYQDADKVHVYGDSVSLRIKSDPADEKLVGQAIAHPAYII